MNRSSLYSRLLAVTTAVCLAMPGVTVVAQISMPMQAEPERPTVRELVSTSKARFAVVNTSVSKGQMKARIVLETPDGKTVRGYGAPYIQNTAEIARLWRDFASANLNMPAQLDGITVTEYRAMPDTSFAVAFVLDHSPSTTMPRAIRMQRAVQTALTQFEDRDFASVIKFTGRVNVEVPATKDKAEYTDKFQVNGLNMRTSGSAVYDAAYRGIEEIVGTSAGKRVLVLFSDGEDNSSSKDLDEVIKFAKLTNTQIHTISYGLANDAVLARLANETGGNTHQLHDVYDFDKVFMGIYVSMRNSYDVVVRTSDSQIASSTPNSSVISSTTPGHGSLQPTEVLALLPKQGIQQSSSSRNDQSLTLNVDLKFEGEASDISAADLLMLDSIATVLVQRADLALEIVPPGSDASVAPEDVVIAQRRATAVRDLLIRRGVHPSRVQGFASRPSSTPESRVPTSKTAFVFTKM